MENLKYIYGKGLIGMEVKQEPGAQLSLLSPRNNQEQEIDSLKATDVFCQIEKECESLCPHTVTITIIPV